jgi:Flp pilus assembly protein TadD
MEARLQLKDPTAWLEDLTVFMDDDAIAQIAREMEKTTVYAGSTIAASACVAVVGILGGIFGAVTFSGGVRSSVLAFAAYTVGSLLLLRLLYPLTVKLFGATVAWLSFFALFWTALLGAAAVMGARIDSALLGYGLSSGAGLFIGLMYGSLNPGVVKREDIWLVVSLALAPLGSVVATRYLRGVAGGTDSIETTAIGGVIAGALLIVPTSMLLAALWDRAHGLSRMGLLYLHNDNFAPSAVAYLDRAIALAPNDAPLYNLRGIAWSKMDQPERAREDWRRASELAPNDPEMHLNRGADFLRHGKLDEAIDALESALALDPDHATAHSNLGIAFARRGDLDRAIAHYDRAIELVPDYATAYSNRGFAYHRKGSSLEALRDCERALALAPELAAAHVNRGHALAALGRTQDAREAYRQVLELDAEPAVQEEALRGLEELGETDEAAERDTRP